MIAVRELKKNELLLFILVGVLCLFVRVNVPAGFTIPFFLGICLALSNLVRWHFVMRKHWKESMAMAKNVMDVWAILSYTLGLAVVGGIFESLSFDFFSSGAGASLIQIPSRIGLLLLLSAELLLGIGWIISAETLINRLWLRKWFSRFQGKEGEESFRRVGRLICLWWLSIATGLIVLSILKATPLLSIVNLGLMISIMYYALTLNEYAGEPYKGTEMLNSLPEMLLWSLLAAVPLALLGEVWVVARVIVGFCIVGEALFALSFLGKALKLTVFIIKKLREDPNYQYVWVEAKKHPKKSSQVMAIYKVQPMQVGKGREPPPSEALLLSSSPDMKRQ